MRTLCTVFVATVLIVSQPAAAAECDLDQDTYFERLGAFVASSCYEKVTEFAAARNRARVDLTEQPSDWSERKTLALQVIEWIAADLESLIELRPGRQSENKNAQDMLERLRLAATELAGTDFSSVKADGLEHWSATKWKPGASESEDEWFLMQSSLNDADCIGAVQDPCSPVFEGHLENARYMGAMEIVAVYILKPIFVDSLARQEQLHKEWSSYLNDQQFQFWWELNTNFCLFNPRYDNNISAWKKTACFVPGLGGAMSRRWATESADVGWAAPPNRRVIYLHPDIGVIYADGQPSGDSVAPALVMQWLGYVWWNGFNERTGAMNNAFGVSLVSTFADLPESDNAGFGVMAHYRQYGLSVTRHSDDWAVYLNFDLLRGLQDTEDRVDSIRSRFTSDEN